MGYVFFSYSSKDRDKVDEFRHLFSRYNVDSWVAPDDIPVGSKYAQVINKAIKNCSCFVLLLTENSIKSQWVAKEVERAINYKRFIIPIKLEEVVLTDEFELYISTDQILPITVMDEISSEVQGLISSVKAHTEMSTYEKKTLENEILSDVNMAEDMPDIPVRDIRTIKSLFGKKTKTAIIIASCAFVLIFGIIFTTAMSMILGGKNNNDSNFDENYSAIQQGFEDVKNQMQSDMQDDREEVDMSGPDQIPEKYKQDIEALKYSDGLTLNNKTLRIKVGGGATPQSAQTWRNVVIYSQNTEVAVGDGLVVKGVSAGETFVIVEGPGGITSAYYVIVE